MDWSKFLEIILFPCLRQVWNIARPTANANSTQYVSVSIVIVIYNITFYQLANFPELKLYGAFYLQFHWRNYTGELGTITKSLHKGMGAS
jgi:hypothetical protein